MARLAMTSLAFMLVWVPLPVCHTRRGKWSSSPPAVTSAAAWEISSASFGSSRPSSALVSAEASLRIPMARIIDRGMTSSPMEKCTSERAVWAPQYRSAGTSMGPIESVSVLVAVTGSLTIAKLPPLHVRPDRGAVVADPALGPGVVEHGREVSLPRVADRARRQAPHRLDVDQRLPVAVEAAHDVGPQGLVEGGRVTGAPHLTWNRPQSAGSSSTTVGGATPMSTTTRTRTPSSLTIGPFTIASRPFTIGPFTIGPFTIGPFTTAWPRRRWAARSGP